MRVTGAAADQALRTAFLAAFSSGVVKPFRQRVREGMESVSKGKASKVTSGEDQTLCCRIAVAVSWEMS